MDKIIVMIAEGKSDGLAYRHGFKLFDNKEEAETYIYKTSDIKSKYYRIAEIVEDGEMYESDRESIIKA